MTFEDPQLEECFERNLSEMAGCSDEMRQVGALLATHDFFQLMEGPHSARVHETVDRLLSAPLRPGLREWYQRFNADINAAALTLRDQLSQQAGEKLENGGATHLSPPEPGDCPCAR